MAKSVRSEIITLQIAFYTEKGDLLDSQTLMLDRTTAISRLLKHPELLKAIANVLRSRQDCKSLRFATDCHFRYGMGFRFDDSGCEQYVDAADTYPTLNIGTLSDLFRDRDAEKKSIDVAINIKAEQNVSEEKTELDCLGAVDSNAIRPFWDPIKTDFCRVGVSVATRDAKKRTKEALANARSTLEQELGVAQESNRISTYDVLLVQREGESEAEAVKGDKKRSKLGMKLVTAAVHDFGGVCYGDCHSSPSPVTGDHTEHLLSKPFKGLNNLEALLQKACDDDPEANHGPVDSGIPIMPPYSWNEFGSNAVLDSNIKWPEGGLEIGVQYIDCTPGRVPLALPSNFVLKVEQRRPYELSYIYGSILEKLELFSGRKPETSKRRSSAALFDEDYQYAAAMELWTLPQEPAPQKLYLWSAQPRAGVERTARFRVEDCLSKAKLARGDARLYMQALVGPNEGETWMITGNLYDPNNPFRAHDGANGGQKPSRRKLKGREKVKNGGAESLKSAGHKSGGGKSAVTEHEVRDDPEAILDENDLDDAGPEETGADADEDAGRQRNGEKRADEIIWLDDASEAESDDGSVTIDEQDA